MNCFVNRSTHLKELMKEDISNNKRIAKNTLLLYFRQILTMLVGLYTVRVVLEVLGVEDYGIYNVVGGIVAMFSFLSGTMSSASQRFFSFDLGRKDFVSLKKTFSLTMLSYVAIAVVALVLCEIFGVWFLNNKMTIPVERLNAANWVLQSSILSFVLSILSAPYMAVIIARERMSAYAYISIIEVTLKLVIVFLLSYIEFDKLKVYSLLALASSLIVTMTYMLYCIKCFPESRFAYYWNKSRMNELLSYAGWNMIGAVANILKGQGVNILLNVFFNPIVNAARGIAFQVQSAINNFTTNFYTAVRPQIVKYYSQGDMQSMYTLVTRSSKYAFFLNMLVALPLIFHTEEILGIWLKEVPDYTVNFTKLIIVNTLIDTYNYPIVSAIQATGKIRQFQSTVSVIILLNLPVSYVLLRLGASPFIPFIVSNMVSLFCLFPRIYLLQKETGLRFFYFVRKVLFPTWGACVVSVLLCMFLFVDVSNSQLLNLVVNLIIGTIISVVAIAIIGINKEEKLFVKNFICKKLGRC